MIRNSIIYRRIWYIKRRNSRKLYIYFRLLTIVIILALFGFYAENYSIPYIALNSGQELRDVIHAEAAGIISGIVSEDSHSVALDSVRKAAGRNYSQSESKYFMDDMALKVSDQLEERLELLNTKGIQLPLGALFGDTALAKAGPDISIKSRLCGRVESSLKSETLRLGDGRVKYGLYVDIHVKAAITVLLKEHELDIKTRLPILEESVRQNGT